MTRKKVLLAENDINNQSHQICKIFLESGYHVKTATNGRLAYEEIIKNHYDLVISDMNLTQINGISLLKRIKESNTKLPVILMADEACVNEAVEAMKLGADDFLLKPLTPKMMELIQAYVANGSNDKKKVESRKRFKIITQDKKMVKLLEIAKDIADSKASIFIQGESGTGKELFARYIHHHSSRRDEPFVAVNCAALPENLLESELFGHEKGAFTGAISRKKGKFELANNGTLLLDEVTEMDYQLQSKLLRVLQEREIDRIGGINPVPVDVRFLATTNRDIEKQIKDGKFREDLHYRLNVIPLHLSPLRERKEDIPLLAKHFVEKYCELDNRSVKGLTDEAIATLMQMPWKGNVRELENVIERAVLMCKEDLISNKDLFLTEKDIQPNFVIQTITPTASLREIEKNVILNTLDHTDGNRTHAAEILGISVRTLRNKMNEYRKKMEIQ
ncbi:MAG: sigma-54-dependent Fis family transcriptional regulator [Thermoplasmata archaeon M8B2D]|nr:MAG: sigma-54-dependent Fis family transcriptional regulator [Thermoplasmata archaeon M8B2D]